MDLSEAIHAYQGEMRRAQFSLNAQDRYGRELDRFARHAGYDTHVETLEPRHCRSYLDTFNNHAPATVALEHTILSSFFKFLVMDDVLDKNPMDKVRRPKVPAARDRKRTRITTQEVKLMLEACETWPERMCLNTLAYLGVRRTALSNLRWSDVDAKRGVATFLEKGNKRITKPLPNDLKKLWSRYWVSEGPFEEYEWVIPNRQTTGRWDTRSPKFIWNIVKDVAERAGVKAHVHAFRAAFAVHFLRSNPRNIEALRQLMGHSSISTTQGYLDELEGEDAMRVVDTLSFGEAA